MKRDDGVLERARDAGCLDERIAQNRGAQQLDLVEWIFSHLPVAPGSRVLELCAGTGAQTLPLLQRVGPGGQVVAVDVSPEALDQIAGKAAGPLGAPLVLAQGDLDDLPAALAREGVGTPSFDLVFCAYGLYYATDPTRTLAAVRSALAPAGRVAVVGPFGPNNGQLFDLLGRAGVEIPEYVRYTSQDFMETVVVPWAARAFQQVAVRTAVNPVRWESAENVLQYWRSTTFYDAAREPAVADLLQAHFAAQPAFVNEKWIMMAEARDAR